MVDMKRIRCREKILSNNLALHLLYLAGMSCSLPVLGLTTILVFLPAMLYGCACPIAEDENIETVIHISSPETKAPEKAESIDVLIFNDDRMQKLDTYQRFEVTALPELKIGSSVGEKLVAAVLNSGKEASDWTGILSKASLHEVYVNLENERFAYPVMSGEGRIQAGIPVNVKVERLASEIVLHSLGCHFFGKGYEDEVLQNIRVYLTNVNAEAPLFTEEAYIPRRMINRGGLETSDINGFVEPGILLQELDYSISDATINPDIRLRCFPNEAGAESLAAAFTRLVIEGEVAGEIYYWPIDINRDEGGKGISRNCRYIFDINITRLGHRNPDTPIETSVAEIKMEIEPWEEKEDYGVRF